MEAEVEPAGQASSQNLLKALLSEIQGLRRDVQELNQTQKEILDKELDANSKGEKTPLRVENPNGGPSKVAREVLSQAQNGSRGNGVETSDVQLILEEEGYERSRKPVLKFMKKLDRKFDNYKYKSGKGQKSSALYYKP